MATQLEVGGKTEDALRSMQKVIDGHEKMVQKLLRDNERLKAQSKDVKKKGEEAFDGPAAAVTRMGAGLVSLAGLYRTVGGAIDGVIEKAARATGQLEKSLPAFQRLGAHGLTTAQLGEARRAASATVTETGMGFGDALVMQKALINAGLTDQRALFARLHGMAEIPKAIESVRALQGTMGGDAAAIANQVFLTAGEGKAEMGDVGTAVTRAAVHAKGAGMSTPELLGAFATLSTVTRSPATAGEMLRPLLSAINKRGGLGDKSFAQYIQAVGTSGMSSARLQKFFGSEQAAEAALLLAGNQGELARTSRRIQEEGLLQESIVTSSKNVRLDPTFGGMIGVGIERESANVAEAVAGAKGYGAVARERWIQANRRQRAGESGALAPLDRFGDWLERWAPAGFTRPPEQPDDMILLGPDETLQDRGFAREQTQEIVGAIRGQRDRLAPPRDPGDTQY